MVDVNDVAESVFKGATTNGLHGKSYFQSGESWRMSDISLMLNKQQPDGESRVAYSNELAKQDLGVDFNPAWIPLSQFGKNEKEIIFIAFVGHYPRPDV